MANVRDGMRLRDSTSQKKEIGSNVANHASREAPPLLFQTILTPFFNGDTNHVVMIEEQRSTRDESKKIL